MMGVSSASYSRFLGFFIQFIISLVSVLGLAFAGMKIATFYKTNSKQQIIISIIIFIISYLTSLILFLLMLYLPDEQMTEFKINCRQII